MLVASRAFELNGQPVVAGQILDPVWPALRERTRRALLNGRWVIDADHDARARADRARAEAVAKATADPVEPVAPRKRGRPRKVKVATDG